MSTPQGVVAVLTDNEGRVVASASDFKQDRPGGFSVKEAQRTRARRALASAMIDAFCSPVISRVLDIYDAERMLGDMVRKHGFNVTMIDIGEVADDPVAE